MAIAARRLILATSGTGPIVTESIQIVMMTDGRRMIAMATRSDND